VENHLNQELYDRVEQLKSDRIIKKDADIVESTGFSKSAVSSYVNGKVKASKNFMQKFNEIYPKNEVHNNENNVNEKPGTYGKKKKTIEATPVDQNGFMEVPYLPAIAYAGYINGLNAEGYQEQLDTMLVPIEFEKGNYKVIEVKGDSMDDGTKRSIIEGDKLLCKELL